MEAELYVICFENLITGDKGQSYKEPMPYNIAIGKITEWNEKWKDICVYWLEKVENVQ